MTLLKNIQWGLRWGLTIAVGFTVLGLIGNIGCYLDAAAICEPSLGRLVGFYFVAGIGGGFILGLFRPAAKYQIGEMFLGVCIVALCLFLLNYASVTGGWTVGHTILVAVVSLIIGPIGALMMRHVRAGKPRFNRFEVGNGLRGTHAVRTRVALGLL